MVPVFSCHDADYTAQRCKDTIKVHQTMHVDAQEGERKGLIGRCVCGGGGGGEVRKRRELNTLHSLIWGLK